ncbi:MAG: argininosuccinate lyase, partial [Acutalibacteraceae bacterium]|nr:argininosuccinate lyase [Acutalibacteraceae bacterium]
ADYLVGRGLPFRDAYKCTGELVALCIEKGTTLEELPLDEYQKVCDLFEEGVYDAISLERCVSQRTCIGAPAPENVRAEAARVAELVK